MDFTSYRNETTKREYYKIGIDDCELMKVKLDPSDKALIKECEESGFVSDKVYAVYTLLRKIEDLDA